MPAIVQTRASDAPVVREPPGETRWQPVGKARVSGVTKKRTVGREAALGLTMLLASFVFDVSSSVADALIPALKLDHTAVAQVVQWGLAVGWFVTAAGGQLLGLRTAPTTKVTNYLSGGLAVLAIAAAMSYLIRAGVMSASFFWIAGLLHPGWYILSVLFVRELAIATGHHNLATDAESILGYVVAIVLLDIAAWVVGPFIALLPLSAVMGIVTLGCTIVMVIKYGTLIREMRLAILGYY